MGTCNWRAHGASFRTDCYNCHWTCYNCDGGGSDDCTSCSSGRYLYDGYTGDYCYECTRDSHCSSGQYCDTPSTGAFTCENCNHANCRSCTVGTLYGSNCEECESGWYLRNGECVECTEDNHCSSGEYCDTGVTGSYTCETCENAHCRLCSEGTLYGSNCEECESGWYLRNGECVECTEDNHCSSGEYCDTGVTGSYTCETCENAHCRLCSEGTLYGSNCEECESGWHLYTSLGSSDCYECTTDSHCGTNQFCDPDDMQCKYRECNEDLDCASGERCHIGSNSETSYCTAREERPDSTQLPERCTVASADSGGRRRGLAAARRGPSRAATAMAASSASSGAALGAPAAMVALGSNLLGSVAEDRIIREAIAAHEPVVSGRTRGGDDVLSYGFRHVGNETGLVTTLAYEVVRSRDLVMLPEIDSVLRVECVARSRAASPDAGSSARAGGSKQDAANTSSPEDSNAAVPANTTSLEVVAVMASADAFKIVEGAVVHGGQRFVCTRDDGRGEELLMGRVTGAVSAGPAVPAAQGAGAGGRAEQQAAGQNAGAAEAGRARRLSP